MKNNKILADKAVIPIGVSLLVVLYASMVYGFLKLFKWVFSTVGLELIKHLNYDIYL